MTAAAPLATVGPARQEVDVAAGTLTSLGLAGTEYLSLTPALRSALASAKPFTEKVRQGDSTLYRARFAGLEPAEAEAACRTLKRSGFACFATRD